MIHAKYMLRNLQYRLFSGPGYFKRLRNEKDPHYVHERDRHPVRVEALRRRRVEERAGWQSPLP